MSKLPTQTWNKAKISPHIPLKTAFSNRENHSINDAFWLVESRDAHRLVQNEVRDAKHFEACIIFSAPSYTRSSSNRNIIKGSDCNCLPINKIWSFICILAIILLEQRIWTLCDNTDLSLPSTEAMKPYVSVLGIPRFVLICCALLFSWAKGDKTTRRFVGLPESGQRVSHNDTSGNNRTLIIRHNLPVSQVVHRSDIYPQWHASLLFQVPLSLMRAAAKTSKRSQTRSGKISFPCWGAKTTHPLQASGI